MINNESSTDNSKYKYDDDDDDDDDDNNVDDDDKDDADNDDSSSSDNNNINENRPNHYHQHYHRHNHHIVNCKQLASCHNSSDTSNCNQSAFFNTVTSEEIVQSKPLTSPFPNNGNQLSAPSQTTCHIKGGHDLSVLLFPCHYNH